MQSIKRVICDYRSSTAFTLNVSTCSRTLKHYICLTILFTFMDALGRPSFLQNVIYRKWSANQQKQLLGTMFFMSKQVSLPNICSTLQKMKIGPKSDLYAFFCTKAFSYFIQWELCSLKSKIVKENIKIQPQTGASILNSCDARLVGDHVLERPRWSFDCK